MLRTIRRTGFVVVAGVLLLQTLGATLIPRLTFEQLTDTSELVVSGQVASSYAAWDAEHKYIWTHYSLHVASALKGKPAAVVEFAEPGGVLGGTSMMIAGATRYSIGDDVVVFLARMPNGYLRTTGWTQGKYSIGQNGRLRAGASLGADIVSANGPATASSLQTLEGMTVIELGQRVAARLRVAPGRVQ